MSMRSVRPFGNIPASACGGILYRRTLQSCGTVYPSSRRRRQPAVARLAGLLLALAAPRMYCVNVRPCRQVHSPHNISSPAARQHTNPPSPSLTPLYRPAGTYQGQWQRGSRHGYGVRTSAAFGTASTSKSKAHHQSASSLRSDPQGDPTAERDRRVNETRGGFVLQVNSDEPPPRRGSMVEKPTTLRQNILQVRRLCAGGVTL